MNIKALEPAGTNTGKLKYKSGMISSTKDGVTISTRSEFDVIQIKRGRYIQNGVSHPLMSDNENYYRRIYALEFENKTIYYFDSFGKKDNHGGIHIGMNWWENQCFLWLQGKHWLQKEENIRYVVNVLFLLLGAYIGINNMK
ncbi:MAG TPA: hypothetical protein PK637_14550 [Flavobacteriales bacterium]|nr:hypothetical protein [Flavobacterium sp.]HRE74319.1 hypothetical protein [Flavobacteriales bacterium]HRE97987.1 hypothetical protein [Flavobacteriales bacterium]